MFQYFSGIHRKYGLPVYPIVIFSHDKPKAREPSAYVVKFPDLQVLDFRYRVIQLNRLDWRTYLRTEDPLACALMAKMDIAVEDRPKVKLECLRMLVRLKLDPARTMLISSFVDTYLRLNREEMKVFEVELDKLLPKEREGTMELTTSWKEEGIEIGIQRGIEKGKLEGKLALILRQISKHFGPIGDDEQAKINTLSEEQIECLGDAIFDFKTHADLNKWLSENPAK